jgi:hypothetical protein
MINQTCGGIIAADAWVLGFWSLWIFQPVTQTTIKVLAPQRPGLLGSRASKNGGRVNPRAIYVTG